MKHSQYLRNAATVCAVVAAFIIAALAPSDADARSRYRNTYKSYGYSKVHKVRHYARRGARHRMTIAVGQRSTAPYTAEVSSESPVQFVLSQSGGSQPAYSPRARQDLKGDGTFGDLVQGTYGGTVDLVHAAERYLYTNPTGRRRAWCRAFVNLVARQNGYRINPSLMARAPTGGYRVSRPVPGAVAKSLFHTGFVKTVSADGRKILLISGNSGGRGPGRRTTTASWRSASLFSYEVLSR